MFLIFFLTCVGCFFVDVVLPYFACEEEISFKNEMKWNESIFVGNSFDDMYPEIWKYLIFLILHFEHK